MRTFCREVTHINLNSVRQGTVEEKAVIDMSGGEAVDVLVEYTNSPAENVEGEDKDEVQSQPALMRGVVRPFRVMQR